MDRSSQIVLVKQTFSTADSIGQRIATETLSTVFCEVRSVGMQEFYQASNNGISPEYTIRMSVHEYNGEKVVIYNNERYGVYRTYVARGETVELYLNKVTGV